MLVRREEVKGGQHTRADQRPFVVISVMVYLLPSLHPDR